MNFLYVCQSVSWLSFLLKLCQYKDSSSSGTDIFLNIFRHIPWIVPESLKMIPKSFIHLSVCFFLTSLLKLIQGLLQFWMRFLSQHFVGISGMFLQSIKIIMIFLYVCQSVSWLDSLPN